MRTHKPVSVSLPPELFESAERRAKALGYKRATYIQQLILADLKKAEEELKSSQSPKSENSAGKGKKKGG